eukprot:2908266-Pyramimonas_sp.AAC.1
MNERATSPRRAPLRGGGFASSFRSAHCGPPPSRIDPRLSCQPHPAKASIHRHRARPGPSWAPG